jgi:hypothetical protein
LHVIVRAFAGAGTAGDEDSVVFDSVDFSDVVDLAEVLFAELAVEFVTGADGEEEHPAIAPIRTSAARTVRTCRVISATIDVSSRRR